MWFLWFGFFSPHLSRTGTKKFLKQSEKKILLNFFIIPPVIYNFLTHSRFDNIFLKKPFRESTNLLPLLSVYFK